MGNSIKVQTLGSPVASAIFIKSLLFEWLFHSSAAQKKVKLKMCAICQ